MANIINIDRTKYKNNIVNILGELENRKLSSKAHSPDYLKYRLNPWHPVFIYDDVQSGGRYHEIIEGSPFLGSAWSCTTTWLMLKSPDGSPLVSRDNPNRVESSRIMGGVYMVSPQVLLSLDVFYENGEVYDRDNMYVFLGDQEYPTSRGPTRPSIKAKVYLMNKEFWRGVHMTKVKMKQENTKNTERTFYEHVPKSFVDRLDDYQQLPHLFDFAH